MKKLLCVVSVFLLFICAWCLINWRAVTECKNLMKNIKSQTNLSGFFTADEIANEFTKDLLNNIPLTHAYSLEDFDYFSYNWFLGGEVAFHCTISVYNDEQNNPLSSVSEKTPVYIAWKWSDNKISFENYYIHSSIKEHRGQMQSLEEFPLVNRWAVALMKWLYW